MARFVALHQQLLGNDDNVFDIITSCLSDDQFDINCLEGKVDGDDLHKYLSLEIALAQPTKESKPELSEFYARCQVKYFLDEIKKLAAKNQQIKTKEDLSEKFLMTLF